MTHLAHGGSGVRAPASEFSLSPLLLPATVYPMVFWLSRKVSLRLSQCREEHVRAESGEAAFLVSSQCSLLFRTQATMSKEEERQFS